MVLDYCAFLPLGFEESLEDFVVVYEELGSFLDEVCKVAVVVFQLGLM